MMLEKRRKNTQSGGFFEKDRVGGGWLWCSRLLPVRLWNDTARTQQTTCPQPKTPPPPPHWELRLNEELVIVVVLILVVVRVVAVVEFVAVLAVYLFLFSLLTFEKTTVSCCCCRCCRCCGCVIAPPRHHHLSTLLMIPTINNARHARQKQAVTRA